jgi:hypothetical protein
LSFFLTIFTPLSPALLLRDGAARTTEAVTGGGDGGLDTRGNGGFALGIEAGTAVALTEAFDADCE